MDFELLFNQEVKEDLLNYHPASQKRILSEISKFAYNPEHGELLNNQGHDLYKHKILNEIWVTYSLDNNFINILSISDCIRDKNSGSMNALSRIRVLQQNAEMEIKRIIELMSS